MPSPAFIVEGDMEKLFLGDICKGSKIARLQLNGVDVSVDAIVKRLETIIRLLNNRHWPIVIVFDREGRAKSSEQIIREVRTGLATRGVTDALCIGVPDRMTENWIIADWDSLKTDLCSNAKKPKSPDGTSGKGLLKSFLTKLNYSETFDGPKLLKRARPSVIARHSPSFLAFRSQISFTCPWLMR